MVHKVPDGDGGASTQHNGHPRLQFVLLVASRIDGIIAQFVSLCMPIEFLISSVENTNNVQNHHLFNFVKV